MCQAWCAMVDGSVIENLVPASLPYVGIWLCLAMQPAKIAIDPNMLIRAKHSPRVSTFNILLQLSRIFNLKLTTMLNKQARKLYVEFIGWAFTAVG